MKNNNYLSLKFSSSGINLRRLERETYKYLYLGLIFAVLFHAGLLFFYPIKKPLISDFKNLPVELITIPPKIRKPIIISKHSPSGIYRFKRKISAAHPSKIIGTGENRPFDYGDLRKKFLSGKDGLAIPTDNLPDSIAFQEKLNGRPKDIVPLKDDVFIDRGQFKSMVVFSPENKKAVQGYLHIAACCGKNLMPSDSLFFALNNLAGAMNYYTNIETECDWQVFLCKKPSEGNSKTTIISNYPLIYVGNDKPFEFTEEEKRSFAEYISSGGFVILDNPLPEKGNGTVSQYLKQTVIEALKSLDMVRYIVKTPYGPVVKYKVANFVTQKNFITLKPEHEIFHSFFDFDNGAPGGYWSNSGEGGLIEGIYLGGRLAGVYLNGYGLAWNDKRNEEQLKMGVNIFVYALSQGKGRYNADTGKMVNFSRNNTNVW